MELATTPSEHGQQTPKEFRVFAHKNFTMFFIGQTVSMLGTWSQALAISWLVWKMTHSAVWLGISGFTLQFPMLLLGLVGGVVADRYDRLRILTALQILCMLQAVFLAVLTIVGAITLWQVLLLSTILGITYAFEFPVRQTFVCDMVGKRDLLKAFSSVAAMFHATRVFGPSLAGFVVAWKGEGACFTFNAATFIPLIVVLFFLDRKLLYKSEPAGEKRVWHAIAEGLSHMRSDPRFGLSTALIAAVSLFGMPVVFLMPIFADDVIGGGALSLGWLMAAGGMGSFFGAFWLSIAKSPKDLMALACRMLLLSSVSLILFSFTKTLWPALAALCAAGFGQTVIISAGMTLVQDLAPNHLRGRLMSVLNLAFSGITPIGTLIAGLVARSISAPTTIGILGGLSFVTGVFALVKWNSSKTRIHAHLKN